METPPLGPDDPAPSAPAADSLSHDPTPEQLHAKGLLTRISDLDPTQPDYARERARAEVEAFETVVGPLTDEEGNRITDRVSGHHVNVLLNDGRVSSLQIDHIFAPNNQPVPLVSGTAIVYREVKIEGRPMWVPRVETVAIPLDPNRIQPPTPDLSRQSPPEETGTEEPEAPQPETSPRQDRHTSRALVLEARLADMRRSWGDNIGEDDYEPEIDPRFFGPFARRWQHQQAMAAHRRYLNTLDEIERLRAGRGGRLAEAGRRLGQGAMGLFRRGGAEEDELDEPEVTEELTVEPGPTSTDTPPRPEPTPPRRPRVPPSPPTSPRSPGGPAPPDRPDRSPSAKLRTELITERDKERVREYFKQLDETIELVKDAKRADDTVTIERAVPLAEKIIREIASIEGWGGNSTIFPELLVQNDLNNFREYCGIPREPLEVPDPPGRETFFVMLGKEIRAMNHLERRDRLDGNDEGAEIWAEELKRLTDLRFRFAKGILNGSINLGPIPRDITPGTRLVQRDGGQSYLIIDIVQTHGRRNVLLMNARGHTVAKDEGELQRQLSTDEAAWQWA